ncbi:MAG TPA: ATP-binding cassette domain-containing protein, partial [Terracidiphilus sp.]|nr:ATP-binding cassette domain-containing protein [Terracidiphilus sp.]
MSSTPASATESRPPAADEPVVEVSHVWVSFDRPVLEDISFSVSRGETRILLGPAGVGKSVLLKVINGLIRPAKGAVRL